MLLSYFVRKFVVIFPNFSEVISAHDSSILQESYENLNFKLISLSIILSV